jgi:hypothetical protein
MSMKNSNGTIGIRTATIQLVAQCLNLLHYRVPLIYYHYQLIEKKQNEKSCFECSKPFT